MTLVYFDTFKYVKLLLEADFNQKQAEAINEAQLMASQAIFSQVATQEDIRELRSDFQNLRTETHAFRTEMEAFRTEIQAEFKNFRTEVQAEFQNVRSEIKDCEHRMKTYTLQSTLTMMVTMIAVAGLMLAAIPFLI